MIVQTLTLQQEGGALSGKAIRGHGGGSCSARDSPLFTDLAFLPSPIPIRVLRPTGSALVRGSNRQGQEGDQHSGPQVRPAVPSWS